MTRQEEEAKQLETKIKILTKFLLLKFISIKDDMIAHVHSGTLDLTEFVDLNAFLHLHGMPEDCRTVKGIEDLFAKLGVKNIPKKGANDKKAIVQGAAAEGGGNGGGGNGGGGKGDDNQEPDAAAGGAGQAAGGDE